MWLIEILKAIILGVVEGITEWLPISSTGHMILVDEFLKLNMTPEFLEMFFVVIQLGAILAVVLLYWRKLLPFTKKENKILIKSHTLELWGKILVACIPAAVIGLLFDKIINALFYNYITVALMLILYGVLFIVIENRKKGVVPEIRSLSQITYKTALFIGIFQVLSLIPGTSRSGATIIGGILVGASRTVAAEFTFFLAIPIMFGASLLKLVKFGFGFTGFEVVILLVGMITAFITSVFAIRFLMTYIKKHDFKVFGWYRIILGIIVVLYFIFFG
ncbi:MAG: undecaprenyl-diphosphate phosphatase [Eubacteriaceae bacterium]